MGRWMLNTVLRTGCFTLIAPEYLLLSYRIRNTQTHRHTDTDKQTQRHTYRNLRTLLLYPVTGFFTDIRFTASDLVLVPDHMNEVEIEIETMYPAISSFTIPLIVSSTRLSNIIS